MTWLLLVGLLTATTAHVLSTASMAQEELPVKIRADFFRYDRRTKVLTATGHVILTADDVVIHADALVANLETGTVTAEGNVRLEVGRQAVVSEALTYNLNTRLGTLIRARAEYTGPLVLGSVHLRAERMEGDPGSFVTIKEGFLTTCDDQDPLVYLTAEEISIILNDKLVGRRVALWLAGRKIITLPYFIIFLRERRDSRLTPVIGYSDAEGLFVKTRYSYFVNERHYGFVLADWMERIGVGGGVEHVYRTDRGQGSAFLYRLENRQTGGTDLRGIFNHSQDLARGIRARLFVDTTERTFATAPPSSNVFAALDLSRASARSSTFVFSTFSRSSTGPSSFFSSRFVHSERFTPQLFGQVVTDFSRSTNPLGTDDELFPRLTLRYAGRGYAASLVLEAPLDLDGDRFPFDAKYRLERLPELTVSLSPFRLGNTLLIGHAEGRFGRFRETTVGVGGRTLDAARGDTLVTVTGPLRLGPGTLGVRAFARATWYTTGDTRLFYGGRLEYTIPMGSRLEARMGYTGQTTQGESPFVFDRIVGTISTADVQLFYRGPQFFARAIGTYDFQTRSPGNIVAQAVYLPRPGWSIGIAASYDVRLSRLDRVEANLDLRLSDSWQLQYVGAFDGVAQRIVHDRVSLTRVFCDCLAASLTYLGGRQEVWLEFWLTAIPWGRGRIGVGGQGQLLFDQPIPFLPRP